MPLTVPIIIMSSPKNQQNRIDILFYYSMHEYSGILACFEHSNFFKVNLLASRDTRLRAPLNLQQKHSLQSSTTTKLTASRLLRSNYELFNHNNFNIRYWSWNYRGCWHQTCPSIDPQGRFNLHYWSWNYRGCWHQTCPPIDPRGRFQYTL